MTPRQMMGSAWKHNKSGHDYYIIGQCKIEEGAVDAFLYRRVDDEKAPWWVRPQSQFLDGRFTMQAYAAIIVYEGSYQPMTLLASYPLSNIPNDFPGARSVTFNDGEEVWNHAVRQV